MNRTLPLRPCYHRTSSIIKADIVLRILTKHGASHLERLTGRSYKELVELLKRFKCDQIDDGRRAFWQRMKLGEAQIDVFEKPGIVIPAITWTTWDEVVPRAKKSRKRGAETLNGKEL